MCGTKGFSDILRFVREDDIDIPPLLNIPYEWKGEATGKWQMKVLTSEWASVDAAGWWMPKIRGAKRWVSSGHSVVR